MLNAIRILQGNLMKHCYVKFTAAVPWNSMGNLAQKLFLHCRALDHFLFWKKHQYQWSLNPV